MLEENEFLKNTIFEYYCDYALLFQTNNIQSSFIYFGYHLQ